MARAIRQRERAERYLAQALARRQRAERAVVKALALRRSVDDGPSRGPTTIAHRRTGAAVSVTERRITRLAKPRDQLRYPDLDVLDPYFLAATDQQTLLYALLDAALRHTDADMGNVQLFDPARGLHIAAQRGFHQPFLDFFAWVRDDRSACGTAAARAQPITVPDVARSAIFGSGPARKVVLDAHARAVQSFPLVGSGGQLLGVFSTHYHKPGRPRASDSRLLAVLTRAAARALQWNPRLNRGPSHSGYPPNDSGRHPQPTYR
jgi:GAF domain-containing protein